MSTKIYDAYKFNKKYSLDELMTLFDKWRNDIKDIAAKEFANICLRKFALYYDLLTMKGPEYFKEQKEKLDQTKENKAKRRLYELFEEINSNEFKPSTIMMYITDIVNDSINCKNNDINFLSQMFKSEIYVYTVSRKILFMYFGGNTYQQYIVNQPEVEDYHYQNQTDRPEEISKSAWERRALNWDIAIGPDYVPCNHGISVQFINKSDIEFSIFNKYIKAKNISNESFPTLDERAERLLDYFDDYPNPPENINSYSVFLKYSNTDEYKNWKIQKKQYIKEHLVENLYKVYTNNNSLDSL